MCLDHNHLGGNADNNKEHVECSNFQYNARFEMMGVQPLLPALMALSHLQGLDLRNNDYLEADELGALAGISTLISQLT